MTQLGTPGGTPSHPCLFFDGPQEFRAWLEEHHASATELWMGLRKKHVADRGLTWEQAVPEALCYGWIDSRVERVDADSVRQRWTPRRPGSTWSRVNVEHVARLTEAGLMQPAGLAAFAARREDRTATYTYEQEVSGTPAHVTQAIEANAAALAFWGAAPDGYHRICARWVTSAKMAATNEKRLGQLVRCCAEGELIPSQRYGREPRWLERARSAGAAAR